MRYTFFNTKGSIMVMAMVILATLTFLATYFLSFTITGAKMTQSYELSTRAYYMAEAGLAEAIFKLQKDPVWQAAFETMPTIEDPLCAGWSISPLTRVSVLELGGSYTVSVVNLGCAKAEISSIGTVTYGDATGRKVAKTQVYKAMGNVVSEFGIFSGGSSENIEFKSSNPVRIHNGSLFSNNLLKVKNESQVSVDNKALAANDILIDNDAQLNAISCAKNICQEGCEAISECPPDSVSLPPLDFDSDEPTSYLSQAQQGDCSSVRQDGQSNCLFTPAQFTKIMWDNYPSLSLPVGATVYVAGDINISASQTVTVNGILAADGNINLGNNLCWMYSAFPYVRCGNPNIVVLSPGAGQSSGLLAEGKVNVSNYLNSLNVQGLIYAGEEAKFSSLNHQTEIHGGVVGRKLTFSSLWNGFDVYLDPDMIVNTFHDVQYSPTITIDHWEENY